MRVSCVFAAAAASLTVAAPAAAAPYVYYGLNGPSVDVPLNTDKKEWVKPGVQYTVFLPNPIVHQQVVPYSWKHFPSSKGTVTMQVRRMDATGRLQWMLGVTPAADAYAPPDSIVLQYWPQLGLTISRLYNGEAVLPVTRFRSEKNPQSQLHTLVFTFVTPLEKGKTTWFRIGTYATQSQSGGGVTFADNNSPTSPWPQFPFLRPVALAVPPPESVDSPAYKANPPSSGMGLQLKLPSGRRRLQ